MNIPEATRAYIYRVLLALQPVVVAYGLLTDQMAALWLSVAAAILGTGLAAINTSTSPAPRHLATREDVREANADAEAADNDRDAWPYTD